MTLIVIYIITDFWIVNNILAISFCIVCIQTIVLPNFKIGLILLWGLFIYDIFWVFFTPVMNSVASSIDAPIKLLFPRKNNFGILGLGDISIFNILYFNLIII